MKVTEVRLKNFRNYESLLLNGFSKGVNLICGANAQGKTNFIESIAFAANGKSFRDYSDSRMIRRACDFARIQVNFDNVIPQKIEACIFADGKKSISVNSVPIKRLSELLGCLNVILFYPDDIKIIKEAPGLRRRFMDIEISKLKPSHYTALQGYHEVLKSKNKLLKEKSVQNSLIDIYNEQLVRYAEPIIQNRAEFIDIISENAKKINKAISGGEELSVVYKPCADVNDVKNSLSEKLAKWFDREKELGTSICGVQKEDILIYVDNKDAKLFCSQGQQRTAILSMKLAVKSVIYNKTGEMPVILLDDVFSELDEKRREAVLHITEGAQTFITAATTEYQVADKVFLVENGRITVP